MDSCSARNVDPGFAAQYSKPIDLMTSNMKSEPGISVVYTSARGGGGLVSAAINAALGSGVAVRDCAAWLSAGFATPGPTSAAAPAAAPLRNPRRETEPFFD